MMEQKVLRRISVVLSAAMVLSSVAGPAVAYGGEEIEALEVVEDVVEKGVDAQEILDKTEEKYYFTVNEDGKSATITRYNKPEYTVEGEKYGDLVIPEKVKDEAGVEYTVTEIGNNACEDLIYYKDGIKIPETVTVIGDEAFAGCYNLKGALVIPDSVTSIGSMAFELCEGLDGELTLGKNLVTIGEKAFNRCSKLKGDLVIPDSVTDIGGFAFYDCRGFEGELKLGKGIVNIGENAFTALGGLNVKGSITLSDNVISVGDSAFSNCAKLDGKLIIGKSVQNIGMMAFTGCKGLNGTLTIPDSVTKIGTAAFNLCTGFTGTLTVGKGLKEVSDDSFFACTGIKRVVNNSECEISVAKMSDTLNVTWADESTGNQIKTVKLATAVRSDYDPGEEPQPDPEITPSENEVGTNAPTGYATEKRSYGDASFVIGYCHKTPFFGKSKPGVESFGSDFAVLYDKKVYKVSKIKVNAKKGTIQILGLTNADKSVVKTIKKATKGSDALTFKTAAYVVSNKDLVDVKTKKDGSISSVKISIFGKPYKAKKDEFEYNEKSGVIKFKGANLTGSYKYSK